MSFVNGGAELLVVAGEVVTYAIYRAGRDLSRRYQLISNASGVAKAKLGRGFKPARHIQLVCPWAAANTELSTLSYGRSGSHLKQCFLAAVTTDILQSAAEHSSSIVIRSVTLLVGRNIECAG